MIQDKLFFVDPPKSASLAEWQEWLERDAKARSAAKAAETRATKEWADLANSGLPGYMPTTTKINGSYGQGNTVSFSGDPEEGDVTAEPAVPALQEAMVDLKRRLEETPTVRGTSSPSGKNAGVKARKAKESALKEAVVRATTPKAKAKAKAALAKFRRNRAAKKAARKK